MLKLMMKFYHPITIIHQYIFSFQDAYSIFKKFVMYQDPILMHLLFIYNILQPKGKVITKQGLNYQVVKVYNY
jgi:hypothetical protein